MIRFVFIYTDVPCWQEEDSVTTLQQSPPPPGH